jgi:hypothetical protein
MGWPAVMKDAGDQFVRAVEPGLWDGCVDGSNVEKDRGLALDASGAKVPIFSARTFPGANEMRRTVWSKGKGDPAL